jgi:hypothetical protein
MQVQRHHDAVYMDHFDLMMRECQITRGFTNVTPGLLPLMLSPSPLRDIALAIGALKASRVGWVHSFEIRSSPTYAAFRLYGRAVRSLQNQLGPECPKPGEDTLWVTFLLGLFEVFAHVHNPELCRTDSFYSCCLIHLQTSGPLICSLAWAISPS